MKRLAVAFACALSAHAALFWLGSGWFTDRSVRAPVSRPVAITMSYRQAPAQKTPANRQPVKPTASAASEKPETPATLPENSALSRAVRPAENNALSHDQNKEVTDAEETASPDDAPDRASARQSSPAAIMREAVPRYKVNPPPRYPAAARRRGAQGTVMLSVHVDEQGRVSNLWLFESSGHSSLDSAALQAVRDWSFEPGMQGGRPVAMWVKVPVRFELK